MRFAAAGAQRFGCTHITRHLGRSAVDGVDAPDTAGLHLYIAACVDQHTVTIAERFDESLRVERTADLQTQVAATGELQAAIAAHPTRTANGQHQALGAFVVAIGRGCRCFQGACVAPYGHVQVTATQGTEAGEANQVVRNDVGVRTKVDPPGRRLRLPARGHVAAALTPEPVTDIRPVVAVVIGVGSELAIAPAVVEVAGEVAIDVQRQVTARLGVPGAVQAFAATVDELLEVAGVFLEHSAAAQQRPWLVERIARVSTGRRSTRRVNAVRRVHAQVATAEQLQVAGAGTHDAEARTGRQRCIFLGALGQAIVR